MSEQRTGAVLRQRRVVKAAMVFGVVTTIKSETLLADTFPPRLLGAWGGRAEYQGDDRASVAAKTCAAFEKNPKEVSGDLVVFQGSEKRAFGGYADYIDKNISIREAGSAEWLITDRHYDDGEGGGKSGYKTIRYTATLKADILVLKQGKEITRYSKCVEADSKSIAYIVPIQRGFYVKADTACERASNATLDLFLGNAFRMNCSVKSL